MTRTRKENRRKDIALFNQNLDVLKAAAYWQPEVPVRLEKPLPQWQVDVMRRRLEVAQQELNLAAAGLSHHQQQQQSLPWRQAARRPRQLAGPPVDPQAQQLANQREVTRIRQLQMAALRRQQRQQQTQAEGQAPSAAAGQQKQQQQQQTPAQ